MRSRVVAGLGVLLVALSCSDDPASPTLDAAGPSNANLLARSGGLESVEGLITALFPRGIEKAVLLSWAVVEKELKHGKKNARRRHMMLLADFTLKMQAESRLEDPDASGPMTVNDGVLRLISLMFGRVHPELPKPPTNLGGDFVVAIVDGSRQTVVTPARFAGVEFPAGAAREPFLLVVRETHSDYGQCEGPLDTRLCQYPRFYDFTPYPETRLARRAVFGVCVMVDGPRKPSKEVDDRLRLAHDAPPDAPRRGYQHVPGEKNGIEILPYIQTRFLDCHRKPPEIIGFLEKLLLPRKAYAIDMGGGGQSDAFSNFNVVDPVGSQDELPP